MSTTKIAAIQLCASDDIASNLATAAKLIEIAAQNGAILVVLPESFAHMSLTETGKLAAKEPLGEGPLQHFLHTMAKTHKVWIIGGTIPIASHDPQKIYAACLVFDPDGRPVGRYDKIHLFDATLSAQESYRESDTTLAGQRPHLVDSVAGKLGLSVCYDLRFPELYRHLSAEGAEIMVVPAAFTETTGRAHWEMLLRSRAIENFCYVIGANQGGQHTNGRRTYGHSMIIDPWGTILAELPHQEPGVVYASIDHTFLHQTRSTINALQHRKLFDAHPRHKPDKVIGIGKNYLDHAIEMGGKIPENPVIFLKPPSTLKQANHWDQTLNADWPQSIDTLDYECELVIRINRDGYRVSVEEAAQMIDAVTVGLDMTIRNLQSQAKVAGLPWTTSKVFCDAAILGPWLPWPADTRLMQTPFTLSVDGTLRQQGLLSDMRLSPAELVAYASEYFPLCAGDIFFTGTPKGVGPISPGSTATLAWGEHHYQVAWL